MADPSALSRGSELLKRELTKLDISYAQAGAKLGVGSSVIARWINGRRTPTIHFALQMQRFWGIPIASWDLKKAA